MQRTALVTGASRGIGAAIAASLAKQGLHVILLARNNDKLREVTAAIQADGGRCSFYTCDVTDEKDVGATLAAIQDELQGLPGVLVNNAGSGGPFHRTDEVSVEEWDRIFNTNVKAAFLFCRTFLPQMKAQQFGRVINISSIFGQTGGTRSSAYAASKHALTGYTKSLAVEWGSHNIACNVISPGYIDVKKDNATPSNDYMNAVLAHIPQNKMGTPGDIASLVSFLASPGNSFINGADIVVDGGMLAGYNF